MLPFIHIGPLTIATFGLMVAVGLLVAAYILQAEFRRRAIRADAFLIIGIAGLAGIVGAKLYHALEPPLYLIGTELRNSGIILALRHLLESPKYFLVGFVSELFSRYGFAWFGGFLGGFGALLILARRNKIPTLEFLDACSPAAAVGYAIGRIGCLLAGDGDYGIPTSLPWGMSFPNGVVPTTERVHPTPIYEFLAWMAIAWVLWRWGAKRLKGGARTGGAIFCGYLVLTGIARFLVEFLRINPRSFFGMSNAQAASVASVILGLVLWWQVRMAERK